MTNIENYKEKVFDEIKHIDEQGNEYWFARELMTLLEFSKWENFHKVIKQAMIACKASNNGVAYYFPEVRKIVNTGVSKKTTIDYKLSRYACYLIVQTNSKIKKDNIEGENNANEIHYKMGRDIRNFIKEQGGTMPEDLPTPKKSLKEIEKEKLIR